ncbi:MAG: YbjN domain-containing protein [Prosthecochloris sp.]|jgi:hypothetical protein|nr:YbjN domain-containing protein [Prosthecochloris sp.]
MEKFMKILEDFIRHMEWTDKTILVDEQHNELVIQGRFTIAGQYFSFFLVGDEPNEQFTLHIVYPFLVRAGKFVDACMLFNLINDENKYSSRITVRDNGLISATTVLDVDSISMKPEILENMCSMGEMFVENYIDDVSDIALTSTTYEALRVTYPPCPPFTTEQQQNDSEVWGSRE